MELPEESRTRSLSIDWFNTVALGFLYSILGSACGFVVGAIPTMLMFRISMEQGWGVAVDIAATGGVVSMGVGAVLLCRWCMPALHQDSVRKRYILGIISIIPGLTIVLLLIATDLSRFRVSGLVLGIAVMGLFVHMHTRWRPRKVRIM